MKLQEELKTTRNRYTLMREEVEVQRRRVDGREQEIFAAQYQNVGLQEEVDKIRQQLKATEEERDALRTSLKEEEVARIAAEGRIPLPIPQEPDEFSSPKKKPAKQYISMENDDPTSMDDSQKLAILRPAFKREVQRRKEADDRIHFMKMECQFRCCPCRLAENRGTNFVHDNSVADKIRPKTRTAETEVHETSIQTTTYPPDTDKEDAPPISDSPPTASMPEHLSTAVFAAPPTSPATASTPRFQAKSGPATPQTPSSRGDPDPPIQFSPTSGTFRMAQVPPIPSSPREISPQREIPQTPTALLRFSPQFPTTVTLPIQGGESPSLPSPPKLRFPTTPRPLPSLPPHTVHPVNSITVTIPLASPAPFTPSATMSREEALEQIRQRRGRARSIAAGHTTPRKQMVDLGGLRRDISAPAGRAV